MLVCAFAFALSLSSPQQVEAGPFGGQGHWVEQGDGSFLCMTHWWNNDCRVGDTKPGDGGGIQ